MLTTIGIDLGSNAVKIALLEHPKVEEKLEGSLNPDPSDGQASKVIVAELERIRKRDPHEVTENLMKKILAETKIKQSEVKYIAATGEADTLTFKSGYFFGMTAHSRGANFLFPLTKTVLDIGALHARAMVIDERSKVLRYRMTGQCASGSGQFLENISRYLGVAAEEVGELSLKATEPEKVSGICAVLAETDVINMVSRGITTENILKGIHQSLTNRLVKLYRSAGGEFPLTITGGLALDVGLIQALKEEFQKLKLEPVINTHQYSPHAGALGAALWGAFRFHKQELKKSERSGDSVARSSTTCEATL